MKTILIDVDDVICTNHFVPVVNMYLNKNYVEDDFKNVKIELELFPDEDERFKFLEYYASLDSYQYSFLKKDAYSVLERLVKQNNVILVTSACHYEQSLMMGRQFTDKWNFLLSKLPFLPPENIIFSNQKHLIKGDIMIDDRVEHLKGDFKHKFLFTCFHNKDIPDSELEKNNITRAKDWNHLAKLINSLT